jgi:hypothetical protein
LAYSSLDEELEPGDNVSQLAGCFALSNFISIIKTDKDAGTIDIDGETEITICAGDGISDPLFFNKSGGTNNGNSAWLVTDESGMILDVVDVLPIDLEESDISVCLVWHICYTDSTEGIEPGMNADDITGCYDLSNPVIVNKSFYQDITTTSSMFLFDLEDCYSDTQDDSNMDYSEFVGEAMNDRSCVQYELLEDNLFRDNPMVNWHSCTEGFDGMAICVSSLDSCSFQEYSDLAVRFSLELTPGPDGYWALNTLSFYEQAPDTYNWINGPSGMNNYPTLYGLRIIKNGTEVFRQEDIPTNPLWAFQEFDFTDSLQFYFDETAVFEFELLAYCLVGNGAVVNAWDLDNVKISSSCQTGLVPGVILTQEGNEEAELCVEPGIFDPVHPVILSGSGEFLQWLVTDTLGNIERIENDTPISFEGDSTGVSLVWLISYSPGLVGLNPGANVSELQGCYELSNAITVTKIAGEDCDDVGGIDEGGPSEAEVVSSIELFPNPVSDRIFIESEQYPLPGTEMLIYYADGSIVESRTLATDRSSFDVSNYQPGLYYIFIKSGENTLVRKFIKI